MMDRWPAVHPICNTRLGRSVGHMVVKLIPEVENEPVHLVKGEDRDIKTM